MKSEPIFEIVDWRNRQRQADKRAFRWAAVLTLASFVGLTSLDVGGSIMFITRTDDTVITCFLGFIFVCFIAGGVAFQSENALLKRFSPTLDKRAVPAPLRRVFYSIVGDLEKIDRLNPPVEVAEDMHRLREETNAMVDRLLVLWRLVPGRSLFELEPYRWLESLADQLSTVCEDLQRAQLEAYTGPVQMPDLQRSRNIIAHELEVRNALA